MTDQSAVTGRMDAQIEEWEKRSDHRAIFLRCYSMMTHNMLTAVRAGQFHDPDWVTSLLNHFAGYYFNALEAYEASGQSAPPVWMVAHEAADREGTLALQNLLLGVNAHINYDLVLTLVDILGPEWSDLIESQRQTRYQDHCHVNTIIGKTIDAIQDQVIEIEQPDMDLIDKALGPLDEWLMSNLISNWRDEVWDQAVEILEIRGSEARLAKRGRIEDTTLARAEAILMQGNLTDLSRLL